MKDNRVLSRLGARELSYEEIECVAAAGGAHTNVCSFATTTMTTVGDGDGCQDFDSD
jgi:hypothetical protein